MKLILLQEKEFCIMEEFLSYNIHVTHINPILKVTGRQLQ